MGLSKDQIARYSRQLILPEIGPKGQDKLLRSCVVIVGAGGLGSPASLYLAAAGVGTIAIIDRETVEPSNLHRQILFGEADVGYPKSKAAQSRLNLLNCDVNVIPIQESLDAANASALLEPYDLVLDGSDNLTTRYLVNDSCVMLGKTLIHAGVVHFRGQIFTIVPLKSACLRCVFPEPPRPGEIPSCQEAGILGASAGILGSLMAHEAIKVLLGIGQLLMDRVLIIDGVSSSMREVSVRRNPDCDVCGDRPSIKELVAIEAARCDSRPI